MKKLVSIFTISLFIFSCQSEEEKAIDNELSNRLPTNLVENPRSANNSDSSSLAELGHLVFSDTLHDFGNMKEGEIVEYNFEYTNTGKKDIIISEAKGSCGCTVPEFSKTPLKSGEKTSMKVTFNSQGKHGFNEKTVTITTNGNPSVYTLKINATVNQ